ncbi:MULTISPECIES: winged helix-turn-helix domain-containing protein [Streptomyces]
MDPGTSRRGRHPDNRVVLSRASVWRLLTGRLGWSLQRPERRAVEWDES